MNEYVDNSSEKKGKTVANNLSKRQHNVEPALALDHNRPNAVAQRKLQEVINNSPQVNQLRSYQAMADNHVVKTMQRKDILEEDTLQEKPEPIQKKENNTGLPDKLKSGIENISGYSMDNVKVHYNSVKPAQLQAHAYAQGTEIHLAPGQEKHLPHEAWHVVQQKQGRVKPTIQLKSNFYINDDIALEREADTMGSMLMKKNFDRKKNIFTESNQLTGTIQRTKDVHEVPGIEGFKYNDIINWNGKPGVYNNVTFIADDRVKYMSVTLNPPTVRYNVAEVGGMTPPARYFLIMHELSHVAYQHPGNHDAQGGIHPDSVLNETQADDSALVNALTHYPEQAVQAVQDFSALIQTMIDNREVGGGSHPLNVTRRNRLNQLLNLILDEATLHITVESFGSFPDTMKEFLKNHANPLEIEPGDVHSFQSALYGKMYYLDYSATITYRHFLTWLPKYQARRDLLLNFVYHCNWVNKPVTVQNQKKETIAGAIQQ